MNIKYNSIRTAILPVVISSFITLSTLPPEVKADQSEQGLAAYQKGDYAKAFQLLKLSAESGDATGQLLLSIMYRHGLGTEKDDYEGFFWCKQAAEQEVLEAQFQLGLMYMEGEGVTDDESEAIKWLWSAADRGYPQASEILQYIFSEEYEAEESDVGC